MSLQRDAELISGYLQWKTQRGDVSPEAYVKDVAKEEAFERVEKALAFIEEDMGGMPAEMPMIEESVDRLWAILRGEER